MKPTPENQIKKKLVALLNSYEVLHWPASAGPYTVNGVPDRFALVKGTLLGLVKGTLLGLECKRPEGKPTPLQARFGAAMISHGGLWMLIDGDEDLALLEDLFKELGVERREK